AMIGNLKETTERNREQDWLKTNLARFTGMLQGQRDLTAVGLMVLGELVPLVEAHQGLIYQMVEGTAELRLLASYGNLEDVGYPARLSLGEGLLGQCALDKRRTLLTHVHTCTLPLHTDL